MHVGVSGAGKRANSRQRRRRSLGGSGDGIGRSRGTCRSWHSWSTCDGSIYAFLPAANRFFFFPSPSSPRRQRIVLLFPVNRFFIKKEFPCDEYYTSIMSYNTAAEVDKAHATVTETFRSNATKDLTWRRTQLRKLWWLLQDNKERIADALKQDLNKHRQESVLVDVVGIQAACLEALANLKKWTADEKPRRTDPLNLVGGAVIRREPKGVSLIISAWNYPFMELLEPLIVAIAAGCAVVLKPSELAPASQDLLVEIVPKYLDSSAIQIVTAGPKDMDHLLSKKWAHIFFTGSTGVGKIIYAKAVENLSTVTLELGGRGPAIVTANANIDLSAKRIANTKFMNSGQVCVGVNHIFVDPKVKKPFIEALKKYFDQFLSGEESEPSYCTRIVNDKNYGRLEALLEKSKGTVIYGGDRNPKTRYWGPTIVDNVTTDDSLLTEELFGPILPIIEATLQEAIDYTAAHDHPLSLYGFTDSKVEREAILNQTNSGGVTFNDCLLHMLVKDAPFGGVGPSGMGAYHGIWGFNEFTHFRTVVTVPFWMDLILGYRYAPYSDSKLSKIITFQGHKTSVPFDREGRDTGFFGGWFSKF
ncbi:Putative Aldehyde dehydrogenase [[Torrubiella] hemipterigena]|uniref:Beta-apo-4'-carotenal oxygenase n=1 Tax=[Torrubiella] hemipterigena TaxID=1531966 RepID=A0A0A1TS48_9HYPO|nr:Putative Aldehyde dehydrogenase [[Torrubiella] hemipterigena]